MGSSVTIDFSRNFDRELKKLLKDEIKALAQKWQKLFDSLTKQYSGKPVAAVKSALKRESMKLGGSFSDRELTDYATLISKGTSIKVKLK
ncbi:hypothetical protein SB749_17120 [Brevibacterium sp. SIMBA_078]|uniref:hypothetical protein n=1 Tax=Brevibacterium sp. SIMBA_078 TaxID=3085816 RepID=UPI00397A895E